MVWAAKNIPKKVVGIAKYQLACWQATDKGDQGKSTCVDHKKQKQREWGGSMHSRVYTCIWERGRIIYWLMGHLTWDWESFKDAISQTLTT